MNFLKTLLFLLIPLFCIGQNKAPKREFRAAWIATVSNIDWPSKPGLPSIQQQQELIKILDRFQERGLNAVFLQVRPAADAFYTSSIEPWSRYLTGKQGQGPFPSYDPLKFAIDECHKRNMELHAWFNPFRALTDSKKNPNPTQHVTREHPNWIISYGGKSYLDPGLPEAREYVTQVILDVVKRYDIDGVHLDDYFYPYRIAGQEFGDYASYNRFKDGFANKDDWRRNNVNNFVANLYQNIKSLKNYVKFGISPFGVWRNQSKDPEGSATRGGQTCYDDLYSDILLWQRKGWLDYCLPQLYWEHGHKAAAFEVLLPWWEKHRYQRHMYYGLGVYRMAESKAVVWQGPQEILKQIAAIRAQSNNSGVVFYSSSSFDKIPSALSDSLSQRVFKTIALIPTMPWLEAKAPEAPQLLSISKDKNNVKLEWQAVKDANQKVRYSIYRFEKGEKIDLQNSENLIAISQENFYLDPVSNQAHNYQYVVCSLDRLWNESKASNVVSTP